MPCHRLICALAATLLLAGCATEAFRRAEAECTNQAVATHPVVLEDRLVRESRKAWVPDGSTICESTVTTVSNDSSHRTSRSADSGESRDTRDSRESRESQSAKDLKDSKDPKDSKDSKESKESKESRNVRRPAPPAHTVRERGHAVSVETTQTMQVCRPGMREVVEYVDVPVQVDINAHVRADFIGNCAAALCMQRMGNARCRN